LCPLCLENVSDGIAREKLHTIPVASFVPGLLSEKHLYVTVFPSYFLLLERPFSA
jgi:hypothetical protein